MDLQLQGKRALVTGSNSGIGARIAERLAAEGVKVVVHGRKADAAAAIADRIAANGGEARVVLGDLSTDEGGTAVAEGVLACWGGIDILVNNAGGPSNAALTWDSVTSEDWIATYQLNTVSAFRMIKACLPGMRERGWGRIIQMGSIAGTSPAPHTIPDYSAAKGALHSLTIHLAKTLADTGITVNAVSPGLVVTPVLEGYLRSIPGNAERDWGEIEKETAAYFNIRVGGLTKPDHLAPLVAFIASPLAAHIHGANLRADGGILSSVS